MGKFIVAVCFSLIVCGLFWHFAPATTGHAFNLPFLGMGVTWMMLIFVGSLWGGYKLMGK